MNMKRHMSLLVPVGMAGMTILSGALLMSTFVSADDTDVVDEINITVPVSCTMSGTGMNTHNATINNGQYNSNIGETTLNVFCNDSEGFAIYAIGYTDNLNGKNVMTSSVLDSSLDIPTGTAISGDNSQWAMKLSTVTSPAPTYPIAIQNSFDSFHAVPNEYTLVAKRTAGTDIGTNAEGSTLKTTYQAYISKTQAAGTYTGQVKYTLVHPHNEPTPPDSMLDIGSTVNTKMKSLASGTTVTSFLTADSNIKSIRVANALPANFVPSEGNTVSTPDSKYPIYIFFDNTNNASIMYFYTEDDSIVLNPDSSGLFAANRNLSDISGLEFFDSSNVENMNFVLTDTAITNVNALSNWNTSNVTSLSMAFGINLLSYNNDGYRSQLVDVSGITNWDTSKVENFSYLFMCDDKLTSAEAVENWDTSSATNMIGTFAWVTSLTSLDLSAWDTSNVTNLAMIFQGATSIVSLDLSGWDTSNITTMANMFGGLKNLETIDTTGWDTSNVTSMRGMFSVGDDYAGNGKLREIIGIEDWDTSNVTDMTTMFYGAGQMTHYDIANWNVSKVESFNHMFCDNRKLESLDLSKWDVSSVKTMYDMFDDNYKLTTIGDVSHWNTASLIDIGGWLNGASSFVGNNGILDLSGWNTSSLKAAGEMFRATKLQTIDLSGWDLSSIINGGWDGAGSGIYYEYNNQFSEYKGLGRMFMNTAQLNTVYVSQSGLNSFNTIVNNGINTTDMWTGSGASEFTVK